MWSRNSLLRRLARAALLLAAAGASTPSTAADPPTADAIIGDWMVESLDAGVRITAVGDGATRRYLGRIVWLKDDRYSAKDGPELAGKPVTDHNNPDPSKRDRLLLGLPLLWDLHFTDGRWDGGRIYNSDDGHTYRCTVRLIDADHLRLHGYIGFELLGGNTKWTRVSAFPGPVAAPSPASQP